MLTLKSKTPTTLADLEFAVTDAKAALDKARANHREKRLAFEDAKSLKLENESFDNLTAYRDTLEESQAASAAVGVATDNVKEAEQALDLAKTMPLRQATAKLPEAAADAIAKALPAHGSPSPRWSTRSTRRRLSRLLQAVRRPRFSLRGFTTPTARSRAAMRRSSSRSCGPTGAAFSTDRNRRRSSQLWPNSGRARCARQADDQHRRVSLWVMRRSAAGACAMRCPPLLFNNLAQRG